VRKSRQEEPIARLQQEVIKKGESRRGSTELNVHHRGHIQLFYLLFCIRS
jgi:hypothetical protein